MNSFHPHSERRFLIALGVITLLGFVLRLWGLWSESFTADEVDTLIRVKESPDVGYLLDFWVRNDGHPPFTHLLEYFWTKVFGTSTGAIRFPFALMGAGAVWFAGRTARNWFGEGAGIAAAAGVAFLQFPIMYSQLARPYAPGLFFTMMLVWFWSKWLFTEQRKPSDLVWFAVAGLGAAYSHYFSLLMAGLIGFTGLFFLRKETWKGYLVAGAAIIALFLPYTGLFLFQLGAGGVGGPGGWLGKPTPAFFGNHLWFIFNESRIVLAAALFFSVATLLLFFRKPTKFHVLAFLFWITPLAIGYIYSVKSNPVLQNSVLLFSFPFLLMLLFAWVPPPSKWKWTPLLPAGFALMLFGFVTVYRPFHLTDHFGRLKEISETALRWEEKVGADNVSFAFNVDYPYYMGYYWEKAGHTPKNVLTYRNGGFNELKAFRKQVEEATGNYFVYGWSTVYSPIEILSIIREKYPYVAEKKFWFNSAVYVFQKQKEGGTPLTDELIFASRNSFSGKRFALDIGKESSWTWTCAPFLTGDSTASTVEPQFNLRLADTCTYSPTLQMAVGDILPHPDNQPMFTVRMRQIDTSATLVLMIAFQRNGEQLYWYGIDSDTQIDKKDTVSAQLVHLGIYLPPDLRTSDVVQFCCYTKTGAPILLEALMVTTGEGHPGIYGPKPAYH